MTMNLPLNVPHFSERNGLFVEMYSFGKQPFEGMTGQETVKFIEEGKRLQRPEKPEIYIYNTMTWCWEYKPQARPCFAELFQVFISKCLIQYFLAKPGIYGISVTVQGS